MDKHWGDMQQYLASVFAWRGLTDIIAEELTVLPGMEELASLLEIVHLYDSCNYDVIIMDCAPTGATLQLLTIPEIASWYLEKIFPLEKKVVTLSKPILRAITDMPIPDEMVFDAIEQLITYLDRMQSILTNRNQSSARLVLNPEKMVIKEAQRAYTYLNLYGYPTDAVICNRILPAQMQDTYFDQWLSIQERYQQLVHDSFAPLPILEVPYFDREVVGLDMLRRMGQALFADRNPTDVLYVGQELKISKANGTYVLYIPLPFVKGTDVQLTRSSADELIVHIGNHKRVIALPHTLSTSKEQTAHYENDALYITFKAE
jgi:arsenite-transporting ATPase